MRLAYADPPYPGKAHLYPENAEVDHAELVARLCEYDGWAISTDETNLAYVLGLCPARTRVLAWCRKNAPPLLPYPWASWEPVLVRPARTRGVEPVRSYLVDTAPLGTHQRDGLTGQKSRGFCEWVIRAMGAQQGDTLDDVFPGTGIMGATFESMQRQTTIALPVKSRRYQDSLESIAPPLPVQKVRDERRGARIPSPAAQETTE